MSAPTPDPDVPSPEDTDAAAPAEGEVDEGSVHAPPAPGGTAPADGDEAKAPAAPRPPRKPRAPTTGAAAAKTPRKPRTSTGGASATKTPRTAAANKADAAGARAPRATAASQAAASKADSSSEPDAKPARTPRTVTAKKAGGTGARTSEASGAKKSATAASKKTGTSAAKKTGAAGTGAPGAKRSTTSSASRTPRKPAAPRASAAASRTAQGTTAPEPADAWEDVALVIPPKPPLPPRPPLPGGEVSLDADQSVAPEPVAEAEQTKGGEQTTEAESVADVGQTIDGEEPERPVEDAVPPAEAAPEAPEPAAATHTEQPAEEVDPSAEESEPRTDDSRSAVESAVEDSEPIEEPELVTEPEPAEEPELAAESTAPAPQTGSEDLAPVDETAAPGAPTALDEPGASGAESDAVDRADSVVDEPHALVQGELRPDGEESGAPAAEDSPDESDDPAEGEPAEVDSPGAIAVPRGDEHIDDVGEEPALRVTGLRKTFGSTVAVRGIDLVVPAGSFYGLVGPNGAGKTTTLSMVAGLLRPDAGSVHIAGVDARARSRQAKRLVGVLPDRLRTFDRLTGRQLLSYSGLLRGLSAATVDSRIDDLGRAFDLTSALGRPVSDYSAGMTKKVMLAGAMIHSPRLLVLDEPFEALDPVSSGVILDILTTYVSHGGTVLLSSHGMDLVERVCTRVAVMVAGQVLAEGAVDEVRGEQSLESRFLELIGGSNEVEGLEWLHTFSD